jgi:hypothetical protein
LHPVVLMINCKEKFCNVVSTERNVLFHVWLPIIPPFFRIRRHLSAFLCQFGFKIQRLSSRGLAGSRNCRHRFFFERSQKEEVSLNNRRATNRMRQPFAFGALNTLLR